MAVTAQGLPAHQIRELTSALWRHAQDGAPGDLLGLPEVRRIVEDDADAQRAAALRCLVGHVDALTPADRRLFTAAIDDVQVRSKLWLIDELTARCELADTTVVVIGAWYGILPLLLTWRLDRPPRRMVCIDIDPDACALGQRVVGAVHPQVEFRVADAMRLDHRAVAEPPRLLVNTICEHLADAPGWWARVPTGQLTVLQSNNYDRCVDHVNCVRGLGEMKAQTPMRDLLYEGVLHLPMFDRFMLIGRR